MNTENQVHKVMRVLGLGCEEEIRTVLNIPKPVISGKVSLAERLQKAETVNECLELCQERGRHTDGFCSKAIEKALLLASTPEECRSVEIIISLYGYHSDRHPYEIKMEVLLKPQLEVASTVTEYLEVCHFAPRGSKTEKEAMQQALNLAKNIKDFKDVFGKTAPGSEIHHICIRRILELLSV
ncbi:MAG: hypothetical protein WC827_04245 [Candidatus Paceibacterota bacterium]